MLLLLLLLLLLLYYCYYDYYYYYSCRSSDTHNPLRSSQLRRRWTVHVELAAGTATQLSTIILVPA